MGTRSIFLTGHLEGILPPGGDEVVALRANLIGKFPIELTQASSGKPGERQSFYNRWKSDWETSKVRLN